MATKYNHLKQLEDILIASGAINTQQLNECQRINEKSGQLLEDCLIEKKFTTPAQIAKAYATYASLPYIDEITEKMVDLELIAKVPLYFLRENKVIPIIFKDKITIVTADPTNFQPLDELTLLLEGPIFYVVATSSVILDAINRYYPLEGSKQMMEELVGSQEEDIESMGFENIEEKDILAMASEAPIIKLVNRILYQAVKQDASDIHLEPFEKEIRVRYRTDGILHTVMTLPKRIQGAIISRIKIMANLNIAEKRVPQDGRIQIKIADKAIDIRVSVLPVAFGERVVMRLLDKSRTFADLKDLGFSKRDFEVIARGIERPNGIIYVTGPTGSGKTTTLYSILGALNKGEVNIVTVEDPVEYQMNGVSQVQVKEKIGMTFAAALRSMLRQDPDIIMIGETRDSETAQIAIQAALTGHLVLSTLHTNDAPSTVTRLIDMGVEPFLIASSVVISMAQRLVRRLCDNCKQSYTPPSELLERIGIFPQVAQKTVFYKAVGCPVCLQSGYRGRIAIFEVMEVTDDIARLIIEKVETARLKRQAIADGMTTLMQDGVRKIEEGRTTIEEVISVATMEFSILE